MVIIYKFRHCSSLILNYFCPVQDSKHCQSSVLSIDHSTPQGRVSTIIVAFHSKLKFNMNINTIWSWEAVALQMQLRYFLLCYLPELLKILSLIVNSNFRMDGCYGNSNLGLICQSMCGVHDKTSIYVLGFHCNFLSQQRLVIWLIYANCQ